MIKRQLKLAKSDNIMIQIICIMLKKGISKWDYKQAINPWRQLFKLIGIEK